MSLIDCINAATKKGIIPNNKSDDLKKMFDKSFKQYKDKGLTDIEANRLAGKETFESLEYQSINKKRQTTLQLQKYNEARKYLLETYKDKNGKINPPEAVKHIFATRSIHEGGTKFNDLETLIEINTNQATTGMIDVLKHFRYTLTGKTRNKTDADLIGREIHDPGSTKNQNAAEMAQAISSTHENLRKLFNQNGGSIPKLENWFPQHHNQFKVREVNQKEWIDYVMPILDRDRMINYKTGKIFEDDDLIDALKNVYNNIITNGVMKNITNDQVSGGRASLANTRLDHRFLHFKDFDSSKAYHQKFGLDANPFEISLAHIDKMARDISFMQVMGPNPNKFMRDIKDVLKNWAELQPNNKITKAKNDVNKSIEYIDNLYSHLNGDANVPVNVYLSKFTAAFGDITSAVRLGGAAVVAIAGDMSTTRMAAQFVGMPQVQTLKNQLRANFAFATSVKNNPMQDIALTSGHGAELFSQLASGLNRVTSDAVESTEITRRIADFVLRVTGLSPWTQASRWAVGNEYSAMGARLANKSFKELNKINKNFVEYLKMHRISTKDWDVIRSTKLYDAGVDFPKWKGAKYLRHDDIAKRTDIDPKYAQDLAYKWSHSSQNIINDSVLTATATGATILGKRQAGTRMGVLARSILTFKQFPLTFHLRHIEKGWTRKSWPGKIKYLGPLFLSSTMAGVFSNELYNITRGKKIAIDEQFDEWNDLSYWGEAILRGGGLGMFGDIMFGGRFSNDKVAGRIAELAGPQLSTLASIADLSIGNLLQIIQGKDSNFAAELTRFVKNNTPGANIWYARLILEKYLFEYLEDYADPKYKQKIRRKIRRTKKEEDNDYWWEPGDKLPQSLPGF
tara:strand:- start:42 stop:2600 length:2559 start_codon:yes stop_codon:yes gene_type:complete